MIFEMLKTHPLEKCLKDNFLPFPAYNDRKQWEGIDPEIKKHYQSQAAKLKNHKWESLLANRYMDFFRNGNRSKYEGVYFQRRVDLFTLMVAECIDGNKEYIDDIINAVWLICEESTWVVPAHNRHGRRSPKANELVDIEESVIIDLFAAETAACLSWVYYFLGDAIAAEAPLVKRRMEIEIERRILQPFIDRDDFWWMGFTQEIPVNNWNPWINSNVLVAFLVFAKDKAFKIKGIEKAILSIDTFVDAYAEDGGCDEGPMYFAVAGGSLLDFLEELGAATDNAINLHDREIVKNMARYIYRAYIGKRYYVDFADAHAIGSAPAGLLYRTGVKIGDDNLAGYALHLQKNGYCDKQYMTNKFCLFRTLSNIFQVQEEKYEFNPPKAFWFEGIQVLTARDHEGSLDGMFVAAKGGHNNESHNHNDIGNFILYCDTEPVIVDAGVGTYTKQTFSAERYTIWSMQSGYHNCPTINGYDQLPGEDKKAVSVKSSLKDDVSVLEMDIKKAYPQEANIVFYNRTLTFNHGKYLEISDSYKLESCKKPLIMNLLAYNKPIVEDNRVLFGKVAMTFDGAEFDVQIEKITITDETLINDWSKDDLYRVLLTQKSPKAEGEFSLRFTKT